MDKDKWAEWARAERDRHRKLLEQAQAGGFRVTKVDGSGQWNDVTSEHIASLKAVITSLDDIIGDAST